MKERLKLPSFSPITAPLALFLICAVVYGPLIYRLGFFWDDWPSIWFLHFWGPEGFIQGFANDRPLLASVFMLTTSILGESTTTWQLFGIFTRYLTGLAWWWTLRGLWPEKPRQALWGAVLFAVYPGFGQQYIAVTYSNAFLVYFLFILSFGTMVWAQRLKRWFWPLMGISIIFSAFSMFTTEYFFGLEFLRPFILWVLLNDNGINRRRTIRQVTMRWMPYLAILIPFLAWKAFFNPSPRAKILFFSDLLREPSATIIRLVRTIFQDFIEVNFLAWFHGLNIRYLRDFDSSVIGLLIGSIIVSFLLTFIYLLRLKPSLQIIPVQSPKTARTWASVAILLGVAAFLVSGWTIWITDLHFELLFPYDRFTLITMLGTSLLISGLIGLLDRRQPVGTALIALLVCLSAAAQFQQRLVFRQEWLSQKTFFWQLAWRAPAIAPGTTLMTSEIPFTYYSDNSLTAPLNWIYAPDQTSQEMPYLLYDIEARLGQGLEALEKDQPVHMPYRAAEFDGSTSQALVLFFDPPRCLKVMNPDLDRFLPVKPLYIREAAPLSRLDLILSESTRVASPPAEIFGSEPPHSWCYFFEKAELYVQNGAWDQAAEMADQALKITKHFTEKNVSELIPFIIGYAHSGKWEKAVELSKQAYGIWDKTQYPLCDTWQSIRQNTPESEARQAALHDIQEILSCKFP